GLPWRSRTTSRTSMRTFLRGSGSRMSSFAFMAPPSIRELHAVDLDFTGRDLGHLEGEAHDVREIDGVYAEALDLVDRERDPHGPQRRLGQGAVPARVRVGDVGDLADADRARVTRAVGEREAQILGVVGGVRGAVDTLRDAEADRGEGVDVALPSRD